MAAFEEVVNTYYQVVNATLRNRLPSTLKIPTTLDCCEFYVDASNMINLLVPKTPVRRELSTYFVDSAKRKLFPPISLKKNEAFRTRHLKRRQTRTAKELTPPLTCEKRATQKFALADGPI